VSFEKVDQLFSEVKTQAALHSVQSNLCSKYSIGNERRWKI